MKTQLVCTIEASRMLDLERKALGKLLRRKRYVTRPVPGKRRSSGVSLSVVEALRQFLDEPFLDEPITDESPSEPVAVPA